MQGQSWGKCYSTCTASGANPDLWAELSVWGDLITVEIAWGGSFTIPAGCSADVVATLGSLSKTTSASAAGILTLAFSPSGNSMVAAPTPSQPVVVTSVSTGTHGSGTVITRPSTHDVFVEIPQSINKCGYNTGCNNLQLLTVDVVVTNPSPTDHQRVRLSFSRNFETRDSSNPVTTQKRPGAEITGLNVQLLDTATRQPTGIPIQLSKNWHAGQGFWADYGGYWWTANALLNLPPGTTLSLTLAINYERYGGVPAWSHAQLSIVGYSDMWLWEQAALGSGGENICFDPLGSHTRAFITDVRPKLFDGKWKENVGGGDFLQMFGADGKLRYLKELDAQILASGPCLSDAQYGDCGCGCGSGCTCSCFCLRL